MHVHVHARTLHVHVPVVQAFRRSEPLELYAALYRTPFPTYEEARVAARASDGRRWWAAPDEGRGVPATALLNVAGAAPHKHVHAMNMAGPASTSLARRRATHARHSTRPAQHTARDSTWLAPYEDPD